MENPFNLTINKNCLYCLLNQQYKKQKQITIIASANYKNLSQKTIMIFIVILCLFCLKIC